MTTTVAIQPIAATLAIVAIQVIAAIPATVNEAR